MVTLADSLQTESWQEPLALKVVASRAEVRQRITYLGVVMRVKMRSKSTLVPYEEDEQMAFVQWCRVMDLTVHHSGNEIGGSTSAIKARAVKMKKMGTLLVIVISILPIVGLVGAGNLSTAIIILGIGVVLVFVASPLYAQFVWLGVSAVGFMAIFLAMESYRLERLAIWRNPEAYEKGYQTLQGLYAIGSGGLFGRGSGESIQKLGFVPEAQNDMIFAIVCEEWGLVGASFLIILFLFYKAGAIASIHLSIRSAVLYSSLSLSRARPTN